MAIKVGINGFGRIGRNIMRAALGNTDIDFVAVNDITDTKTLAHLLKYDSILGNLDATIEATPTASRSTARLQGALDEDPGAAALEGPRRRDRFRVAPASSPTATDAAKHLTAGAKKVIITAPAKEPDGTLVMGVNEDKYDPAKHHIISNASCTTNCLAPFAKVLHENFGSQAAG